MHLSQLLIAMLFSCKALTLFDHAGLSSAATIPQQNGCRHHRPDPRMVEMLVPRKGGNVASGSGNNNVEDDMQTGSDSQTDQPTTQDSMPEEDGAANQIPSEPDPAPEAGTNPATSGSTANSDPATVQDPTEGTNATDRTDPAKNADPADGAEGDEVLDTETDGADGGFDNDGTGLEDDSADGQNVLIGDLIDGVTTADGQSIADLLFDNKNTKEENFETGVATDYADHTGCEDSNDPCC